MGSKSVTDVVDKLAKRYEDMMQLYSECGVSAYYEKANDFQSKWFHLTRWYDAEFIDRDGFIAKSAINCDIGLGGCTEDLLKFHLYMEDAPIEIEDGDAMNVICAFAKRGDLLCERILKQYVSHPEFYVIAEFSPIPMQLLNRSMTAKDYGAYIAGNKPISCDPFMGVDYYL